MSVSTKEVRCEITGHKVCGKIWLNRNGLIQIVRAN